jgi:hypothetical protein
MARGPTSTSGRFAANPKGPYDDQITALFPSIPAISIDPTASQMLRDPNWLALPKLMLITSPASSLQSIPLFVRHPVVPNPRTGDSSHKCRSVPE